MKKIKSISDIRKASKDMSEAPAPKPSKECPHCGKEMK